MNTIAYNSNRQTITYETGKVVRLTTKQNIIFKMLMENMNATVTRTVINQACGTEDCYFSNRSMDVFICKLKKLLVDTQYIILNVHGKGYKLCN